MIVGHKAPELAPFSTRSWCRGLFAAGAVALGGHGAALRADQVGKAGRLAGSLLRLGPRPDLGNGTHLCKSTQTVLPAAPSGSTPHWLAIASTAPSPCSGTARSVFPRSGVASRTEIRNRSSSADKMTVKAERACTMALA